MSIKLPVDLLQQIDAKSAAQDLNRSQYFRRLAKVDLLVVPPAPPVKQEVAA